MNAFPKFSSYAMCISLGFFTGCSSNDEPKPFNCDTSDLDISVTTFSDPTSCVAGDGSITVVASGGEEPYQYQIESEPFDDSNVFDNLGGGTYTITVKDKNGCTVEESKTLVIPGLDPLTATAGTTPDTECLSNDGSITVSASGGTGPYEYKLGTGSFGASEVFNNVSNGNQTITVKDAVGCTFILSVNVSRGNTGITYEGEILAIFTAKCQFSGCHPDNGDWFTYSTASANASTIKSKTADGSMPKNDGIGKGGDLSANQRALIACWVDDGAPQN
jgi:hypothetical protein